jgi:hypothetical protein
MTLEDLMRGVKAVYEYLPTENTFKFLGSSFTVVFNDRYYLVTADHVIDGKQIDALRFFDPVMLNKLAFKGFYPPKSEDERDDLAIFEIDNSQLEWTGFVGWVFYSLTDKKIGN